MGAASSVSRLAVALVAIAGLSAAPSAAQQNPIAQEPAPPPPRSESSPQPDLSQVPLSLDRIRDGVKREPRLNIQFLNPNIPLFRVHVEEKGLTLEDYWKIGPDTAVSRNVRASHASTWHHEFLSMTTPQQHIAASPFGIFGNPVHPVGVPVVTIGNAIRSAWRNWELERIRRQIQEELKALEEGRQPPPPPDDQP